MKSKLDDIKSSNPILELQFCLRDIAQVHKEIPSVFPTGVFDKKTEESVKEFQKKYNLPVTGKVNFLTWNKLMDEHKDCMHHINAPSSVGCYPSNVNEYKKGDSGNLIYILQIILKNFNNKYKNYSDVQFTGVFDEQTESALKQFQKYSNLPVTGVLDRKTWNIMNKINDVCKLYE